MNKEQEQRKEELKGDLEFLKKMERIQVEAINVLSKNKNREEWESKLLTEFRGLAVECQTLIETKTKEMKELCGQ